MYNAGRMGEKLWRHSWDFKIVEIKYMPFLMIEGHKSVMIRSDKFGI